MFSQRDRGFSAIAVIPARYASTRLPAKPLADIHGKPMIQWVYEQAEKARSIDQVWVATDDERIMQRVRDFGGQAILTSPEIQTGTLRVAAVADQIDGDIFVNVQGDEPLIEPEMIDRAVELVRSGRFPMGTAMTAIRDEGELDNPTVVKVIADRNDRAIYFSRLPIPYSRGSRPSKGSPFACMRHLGLYVFNRRTLMRIREIPPTALEQAEVLEQLRALHDGIPIGIVEVKSISIGVDTAEDLEKVRGILV